MASFASKRAMDRMASALAPQLAERNVWISTLYPADGGARASAHLPGRMRAPREYTGRIFAAEQLLADLGIDPLTEDRPRADRALTGR